MRLAHKTIIVVDLFQALAEVRDYLLQVSGKSFRTAREKEELEGHVFAPVRTAHDTIVGR